jgi:enoyl-CoA hydratase
MLTLSEALQTALANQPQLRQASAETQAAQARANESRSALYPQVAGTASYQRSSTSGSSSLRSISGADFYNFSLDARQLVYDLLDVELPIVAALNGPAVGLGASIALLCDVIFMAETATLADPHVRVGIVAGDGGTAIWPLVLGPARAKQYLLTGDPVPAAEAERLGLVNRVVAPGALQDEALAFARRLAEGAPLAVRYTKLAVNQALKQAATVAFDVATALEIVTFQSADHREALAALREKRKPKFEGR